jgi:(p)ppGpp synthase/HD superfamily hydrolase
MTSLEHKAREFATRHHAAAGQVRKYTGEPYINHPAAVVELVRGVPHTEAMLAAAWLHDTVEDTTATLDEVRAEFGDEVTELVGWLTDVSRPEDGNRVARKAIDREHTAQASPEAKTIKLADLIDNSRSILERDPGFARVYLAEKKLLLEVLKEGNAILWAVAADIVRDADSGRRLENLTDQIGAAAGHRRRLGGR